MQVAVLASGSKGNATFIEMEGVKLLVDAGISTRRIKQEMSNLGVDIADLDGIFITHEHIDHVKGLATFSKKYRIALYSRPETFRAMSCYREIPIECLNPIKDRVTLGRISVRAFDISHDAVNPVGYVIQGSSRCVVATDTGYISKGMQAMLEGAQVMVLEANHDVDMLKMGPYPRSLQLRILGRQGHLSNEITAQTLAKLKNRPKKVFLAHLSEQNNSPEVAMDTVKSILAQEGIEDIELFMTSPNQCVSTTY